VAAPALTWYLAEGATHSGFNLFYLLQNPNAAEAEVRVRYLRPSGAPLEKTYVLPPTSRTNIWVDVEQFPDGSGNLALASTDVSAVFEVTNGQPIIVERAMYFDVPGQTFGAGHESAGITAPALEWFLAEGRPGPFFDLFVLIANPAAADATIEARFLRPEGTTLVRDYVVAANSRFNIWVDRADAALANTPVSTTIRSTNGVPIIVERAMWWPESVGTKRTTLRARRRRGRAGAGRRRGGRSRRQGHLHPDREHVGHAGGRESDPVVRGRHARGANLRRVASAQPVQRLGGPRVPGGCRGCDSAPSSRAWGRRRQRSSSSGRCTGTPRTAVGRRHQRARDQA